MSKIELLRANLANKEYHHDARKQLLKGYYINTLTSSLNELKIAWLKLKIAVIEIFIFK